MRVFNCFKPGWFLILAVVFVPIAQAQLPSLPGTSPEGKAAEPEADPYGRETPRSAFMNFVSSAQRQNFFVASHYLQLPENVSAERRERVVRQLHTALDRGFNGDIDQISRQKQGSLTDGLPPQLERAGSIQSGGQSMDVLLIRVNSAENGPVWLIASETLAQVPGFLGEVGLPAVEANLPRFLIDRTVLGMPLWMFLAILLLLPVAFGLAIPLVALVIYFHRRARRRSEFTLETLSDRKPAVFLVAILIHYLASRELGLPLLYRQYYTRFIGLLVIFGFAWLIFQIIDRIGLRLSAELANRGAAQSALLLAKRIVKAIVFLALVLLSFQHLGFNVAPALATLGIGGLAVALAAQKSLENLFGGISVLSDRAIRVGDFVRLGTLTGTVEDIGLRSTRIRTLERTVVSVPNGILSSQNLENFAWRDMFWFHPTLTLRYETSPDQLRQILAEIRMLLYGHAKVKQEGARVRFIQFGATSLDLEIFSYIEAVDHAEFLAVKEDLLLRIMEIVENAGSGFAFPSQTVYISRDHGLDPERKKAAEEQMRELMDKQQAPFPDHSREQIERAQRSIEFPPKNSVLRQQ